MIWPSFARQKIGEISGGSEAKPLQTSAYRSTTASMNLHRDFVGYATESNEHPFRSGNVHRRASDPVDEAIQVRQRHAVIGAVV
jgi:hypothetical protein